MTKKYIKFITLILIVSFMLVSVLYAQILSQTKVIESKRMRVKVANLIVKSKFDNFWQGQMYKDRNELMNTAQPLRVEYFAAVLFTLTDKLQKNGEATLIFYKSVPVEDRIHLHNKLNELEYTKYFGKLEDYQKEYILSMKKTMKSSNNRIKTGLEMGDK